MNDYLEGLIVGIVGIVGAITYYIFTAITDIIVNNKRKMEAQLKREITIEERASLERQEEAISKERIARIELHNRMDEIREYGFDTGDSYAQVVLCLLNEIKRRNEDDEDKRIENDLYNDPE